MLLRLLALVVAMSRNPEPWADPDEYRIHSELIVINASGVHWDVRAFMLGPLVKAPLYPFVLAVAASLPAPFPLSAALIQIALGAAAVAGLFVIGREMHSELAGLIAAAVYAVWLPSLGAVPFLLQEQLHVPLVIAGMALLLRASARSASPVQFAVAGGVLGLAALARLMPLYYIGPAAVAYVALADDRRRAIREATSLLLGFVVVVLPVMLYISAKMGRLVLIDNMGGSAFGMIYRQVRPDIDIHTAPPPSAFESIRMVWREMSGEPKTFVRDRAADFQRLFRLVSWQWLEAQPTVARRSQALALRAVAGSSDALFGLSAVLAPLGVVLARRRREAILAALWVCLHIGLLIMFAWSGVRYREPYEPFLIALAAVVVAGTWRQVKWLPLALALTASFAISAAVGASIPRRRSRGRPMATPRGSPPMTRKQTSTPGDAGFSAVPARSLTLSPGAVDPPHGPRTGSGVARRSGGRSDHTWRRGAAPAVRVDAPDRVCRTARDPRNHGTPGSARDYHAQASVQLARHYSFFLSSGGTTTPSSARWSRTYSCSDRCLSRRPRPVAAF